MREKIKTLVESKKFNNFIVFIIIFNAITLGLETSKSIVADYGEILKALDRAVVGIFVIEIVMKLIVYRFKFFKSAWNILDLAIVGVAIIPSAGQFSVLRALRILRVLRLISSIKSMRSVVESLFKAIPGISSVILIIGILFYIFAVIGTKLFGADFPIWFGDLGKTLFTLFQIMTLESWSMGIVRPIMDLYPSSWIYFASYILLTTFTMVNLFIAVIVNSMQNETDTSDEDREKMTKIIVTNQKKLNKQTDEKFAELNKKLDELNDKLGK
jgi:voltage-gated sodium channel